MKGRKFIKFVPDNSIFGRRCRIRSNTRVMWLRQIVLLLLISQLSVLTWVSAQDDPVDTAPPPLKILSKEERQKLDAESSDIKERTKLALGMMNNRLGTAEKLRLERDYDAMFRELGFFHGLVDDSVAFLEKGDTSSGKVLDALKRLEIGLRGFIPRLETVRREVPLRYEDYLRHLMKFVRDARARAIDPMFGESVVRPKNGER